MIRTGPVDAGLLQRIASGLGVPPAAIRDSQWVDNGPGWVAVLLDSREQVLALRPDYAAIGDLSLGVIGPWNPARDGTDAQCEVRAFVSGLGVPEDPVTGSLNAGLAQWLIGSGRAPDNYVAAQGTALGREGRVYIQKSGADIWVGGEVGTCIEGTVTL